MVIFLKEYLRKIKNLKEMVIYIIKMEIYIMVIYKMAKNMNKEYINIIIMTNLKVYLMEIKNLKEMDIYIMKMEIYIIDIQKME